MGGVLNCDLSEWYRHKCGGNFYHSNTVLYHITLDWMTFLNIMQITTTMKSNEVKLQHLAWENQSKLNV